MKTERLQTLADGVIAIALTLLVLELPVPEDSSDLGRDLLDHWPSYAAYFVSFVTIAIVWLNHHVLLDGIRRLDRSLIELNLLLLMFIALVPWPTGLLADYLRDSNQSGVAAAVYGLVMLSMSASFAVIWIRLSKVSELATEEARPRIPVAVRRSLAGPVIYACGIVIALVSAPAAFATYAAAAAYFALSGRGAVASRPTVD